MEGCQAPIDKCIMNGNYEFIIYNSNPLETTHIKFKTLPFYRITNVIVPLIGNEMSQLLKTAPSVNGKFLIIKKVNKYFEVHNYIFFQYSIILAPNFIYQYQIFNEFVHQIEFKTIVCNLANYKFVLENNCRV